MHHNEQNRESDGFQQNFTSTLQLKNTVARNCGDDIFYNHMKNKTKNRVTIKA
jgi:hypothetical protein